MCMRSARSLNGELRGRAASLKQRDDISFQIEELLNFIFIVEGYGNLNQHAISRIAKLKIQMMAHRQGDFQKPP